MEVLLQQSEADSEQIAVDQRLENELLGEIDEDAASGAVGCTQRLQDSNHIDALKHNHEQPCNEGESRHHSHENDDYNHVHVEEIEPGEIRAVVARGVAHRV